MCASGLFFDGVNQRRIWNLGDNWQLENVPEELMPRRLRDALSSLGLQGFQET